MVLGSALENKTTILKNKFSLLCTCALALLCATSAHAYVSPYDTLAIDDGSGGGGTTYSTTVDTTSTGSGNTSGGAFNQQYITNEFKTNDPLVGGGLTREQFEDPKYLGISGEATDRNTALPDTKTTVYMGVTSAQDRFDTDTTAMRQQMTLDAALIQKTESATGPTGMQEFEKLRQANEAGVEKKIQDGSFSVEPQVRELQAGTTVPLAEFALVNNITMTKLEKKSPNYLATLQFDKPVAGSTTQIVRIHPDTAEAIKTLVNVKNLLFLDNGTMISSKYEDIVTPLMTLVYIQPNALISAEEAVVSPEPFQYTPEPERFFDEKGMTTESVDQYEMPPDIQYLDNPY